jgi:hypothetical protein
MAKVRSPNYPQISLDEAVARIKMVFDKEHRYAADKDVVARALGYGGLNGASMGVISALLKYGLLEPVGEQLRVSATGLDVVVHGRGEPERVAAVRRAAFSPALFSEFHDLYGDTLPSDHSLRAYLVKKGFNPRTVDGVIRAYRDTMTFVEQETAGFDNEPDDELYHEELMQTPTVDRTSPPVVRGPAVPAGPPPQPNPDEKVLWFQLSEDTEVRSVFKGRPTQEAIRKFIALLEISADAFPKRDSGSVPLLPAPVSAPAITAEAQEPPRADKTIDEIRRQV